MKIKFLSIIAIAAIGLASCQSNTTEEGSEGNENNTEMTAEASSYSVNADDSKVSWKGSMLGVYAHTGDINISDASLTVAEGMVTGGSFTIDMNSIVTTDDDALYKMASREDFIAHMASEDFFASETHPTSTFVVKSMNGNTILGDLTVRGITSEESVTDVVISEEDGVVTASGRLVFDRQKYDIKYKTTMGDMILGDDIELDISIKASAN